MLFQPAGKMEQFFKAVADGVVSKMMKKKKIPLEKRMALSTLVHHSLNEKCLNKKFRLQPGYIL